MIIDRYGRPIQAALRMDESSPRAFGFMRSHSGEWITHDSFMTIGAVNACVRVVSETIGVLDWHLFEVDPTTRQRRRRGDLMLDRLLALQPNREMTAKTLKEVLVGHMMVYGNGYAEIVKDESGRVVALWPLRPDRVCPMRDEDGELYYEIRVGGETLEFDPSRIFHLKGFGFDGMRGYDVVSYMMETAGYAIALETFASTFFGNGAHASGALTYDGATSLSKEAKERLRADIDKVHRGAGNAHKLFLLEGEGWDFKSLSITPEQAQMIESRKLSIEDVARWLRVPLHKIGHLERAHFNNVEQLGIQFVTDTILPIAVSLEQEADVKLLGSGLRQNHYTKLNLTVLTRGDLNSRMQAYRIGREIGMYSPNDLREMEGMDPITTDQGGDTYIVPMNFQEAKAMLLDTELKENPPDEPVEPTDEPVELMRNSLRAACDAVISREEKYVATRISKDEPISSIAAKQVDYAREKLTPVVLDILLAMKREPNAADAALRAALDSYQRRVWDVWADATAVKGRPDLRTASTALEYDVLRGIGAVQ